MTDKRVGGWHGVGVTRRVAAVVARSASLHRAAQAQKGRQRPQLTKVIVMLDFLMIAYGVGFFIVAILYVVACEKM